MSKLFEKYGGMRVEVTWSVLKPLIDGTTAKIPYIEGVDEAGHITVAALDGNVGYFTTLVGGTEASEFVTAKVTATPYLNTPTNTTITDTSGTPIATVSGVDGVRLGVDAGPIVLATDQPTLAVSIVPQPTPPGAVLVFISADNPLSVNTEDEVYTIPSGKTFYLQQIIVGNEDPAKGARVEVVYDDGTERTVARTYTSGETVSVPIANQSTARDGTAMVGNGSNTIIVRRTKLTGSNLEVDAIVRGYTL